MILPFTKIVRVKHCYEALPATFYHYYKGTYYKVNFILQHEVKNQRNAAFPYYTYIYRLKYSINANIHLYIYRITPSLHIQHVRFARHCGFA